MASTETPRTRPDAVSAGTTVERVPSTGDGERHGLRAGLSHTTDPRIYVLLETTAAEGEAAVTNTAVTNKTEADGTTMATDTNAGVSIGDGAPTTPRMTRGDTQAGGANDRQGVAPDEDVNEGDTSPGETKRVVVDVGKQLQACGCGVPRKGELDAIVTAQLQAVCEQYANDGVLQTAEESMGEENGNPEGTEATTPTGTSTGGCDHDEPPRTQDVVVEELRACDIARAKVLFAQARGRERLREEEAEAARQARKHAKRVEHARARRERRAQRVREQTSTITVDTNDNKDGEVKTGDDQSAVVNEERSPAGGASLQQSRARRRYDKRVRKARAKEKRHLQALIDEARRLEGAYFAFEELHKRGSSRNAKALEAREAETAGFVQPSATKVSTPMRGRRRQRKRYAYTSGSVYAHASVREMDDEQHPVRVGRLRAVQAPVVDSLPTVSVRVKDKQKEIKLDTGAQFSVAGEEWQSLGERLTALPPVDYVEGFTGAVSKVLGVWRFRFRTQYEQNMVVDALVVEGATSEFLLGEDWMLQQGVKIDFISCEMKWYADDVRKVVPFWCSTDKRRTQPAKVRVVRRARVRTATCHNVELAVAAPDGTEGLFMPTGHGESHILLGPTLTTVRDGMIVVPVMNLYGRNVKLPPKEKLGTWAPTGDEITVLAEEGELDRGRVRQWLADLQSDTRPLSNEDELNVGDMSEGDRELLLQLLRIYPTLLEPREGCPPATTLGVEHEIHTGTEAPIKVRPRRHAHEEQRVIDDNVDEMLRGGVIEEGHGAWGFPVVLVKKKDGSVRFCIDYRLLNAITTKDVYPLPRIDDTLDHLHGAKRFTTLDLHSGYWQVPVAEKDRDKTGFVTRRGLFRFVRMPFGLANAPGTFQRMMDAVLRGLTWQTCLVYLDDVIIFTKGDVTQHVVELAAVLERLARAGLSLKAKKCAFAAERLEYLGHELDADGVRPMESLVSSVANFPVPQNAEAVKRFVAMAGYYRRFVPEFASRAAPMTKLLRKGVVWRWGEAQQSAFEDLKGALTGRPILVYPDFSRPFRLVTDASVVGLGAALTQDQGNGEQPVAYASKVNSETVARYGISELECAAVIWAVKLFRPYLYGRRFQLVTDHSALKWLMTSTTLSAKLHRWALQLQEYDFEVIYRPGADNVVADALSRAPVGMVTAAEIGGERHGGEQRRDDRGQQDGGERGDAAQHRVDGGEREGGEQHAERRGDEEPRNETVRRSADEQHRAPDERRVHGQQPGHRPTPAGSEGQLTNSLIRQEQDRDKTVQKLKKKGKYGARPIVEVDGIVCIKGIDGGNRVVLPTALWAMALRENHDSVYACHLRTPQTLARIATNYWWPDMRVHVRRWVQSCRDCGSRKAKAKEVVPPLRSQGVGEPGDRWALDVAGPLPITPDGNRYVIAAVDYATRYAVVAATPAHTAKDIARFMVEKLVLVHGPMREVVMDGAPELNGQIVEALVNELQAKQLTPVPYRPALLGLVERFHRTWKDMVSLYVSANQDDWDRWLPCAAYAYNGARHTSTGFSPNELMMGRRLRAPNELLRTRTSSAARTGTFAEHYRALVDRLTRASEVARAALAKDQLRREKYYNRRVRETTRFGVGDLVWVLKPPRGKGITKLAHQWVGPARIVQDAGYDNWEVAREDNDERLIVHCSFLVSSRCPSSSLGTVAEQILRELAKEDGDSQEENGDEGVETETQPENDGNDSEGTPIGAGGSGPTAASQRTRPGHAISESPATTGSPEIGRQGESKSSRPAPEARGAAGQEQMPHAKKKRRRKAGQATKDNENERSTQQRRRQEADAAREARASHRQAVRDQQEAAAAAQYGADGDRGLHVGAEAGDGDERASEAREPRGDEQASGAREPRGDGGTTDGGGTMHGGDHGATVEMVQGRGRPRRPAPMPELLQVPTAGFIVERARRRVRNRAGRYVQEHEVEYGVRRGGPMGRRWLSAEEFEALDDAHKIEDDLDAGDGV